MHRTVSTFIVVAATLGIVVGITAGDQPDRRQTAIITYQYQGEHADTALQIEHEIKRIENDAYLQHLAEVAAEQERNTRAAVEAARSRPVGTVVHSGTCENIPGWFPTGIAWRESRCSYDAYNPTGCGGHGCVGLYQFDSRHFDGWANGQAACGDLNATIPSEQDECAWRLSRGGTNFQPWGS
jgi:hypothetical protein